MGRGYLSCWSLHHLISHYLFPDVLTLTSVDERPQGVQTVPLNRVDNTKAHPKSGLLQLDWNTTGTLLLARFGQSS